MCLCIKNIEVLKHTSISALIVQLIVVADICGHQSSCFSCRDYQDRCISGMQHLVGNTAEDPPSDAGASVG